MGFLHDLISNPVGAISGATSAKRQVNRAAQGANAALAQGLSQAQDYLDPYSQIGPSLLERITAGLAPGGEFSQSPMAGIDPNAYAFDPNSVNLTADPGYQFRLQQGLNAAQNSAAARGSLLSGQTLKGLNDYAQGSASQEYQNAYQRALDLNNQNYSRALVGNETAYNRGYQQQSDLYNRLRDALGIGINSSTNLADAALRSAGAASGNLLSAGTTSAGINAGVQAPFMQQLFNSALTAATSGGGSQGGGGGGGGLSLPASSTALTSPNGYFSPSLLAAYGG